MPLAMPTGSSAPMRPICVVATCVARLRIHGCARCATRRVHWVPITKAWKGPLDTESLGRPTGGISAPY